MSTNPSFPLRLRKFAFSAVLLLTFGLVAYWITQENKPWVVPEEYKSLRSPLTASESNLKAAREIYGDECLQCHGERGQGDGPEARTHYPLPADLTDAKRMATVSDGEIFYQINEGRRPMPSFKNRLTPDQRWQLVLLVRSFSQPAAPGNTSTLPPKPSAEK
ncbi:MAG TPA: cytochrome c [Candidatus Acidoferrum sp.]